MLVARSQIYHHRRTFRNVPPSNSAYDNGRGRVSKSDNTEQKHMRQRRLHVDTADGSFQRQLRPVHTAPRRQARDPHGVKATQRKRQYMERLDGREKQHKPDSTSPAIAARLAVTVLPVPGYFASSRWESTQNISIDDLSEKLKREHAALSKCSAGRKAMSTLLSPPDDPVSNGFDPENTSSEELGSLPASSASSDSSPYLGEDRDSISSSSAPPTPDSAVRTADFARKDRTMASLEHEDCFLNHPLMPLSDESCVEQAHFDLHAPLLPAKIVVRKRASLKTKITASLQSLKSAAKAFLTFHAPCTRPGAHIFSGTLLPLPVNALIFRAIGRAPDPQRWWYLNPTWAPMRQDSPSPQDVCGNEWMTENESSMIQMQTYSRRREQRNPKRQDRTTSQATTTEAARAMSPCIRQREPRENSDFLRIVVLEMNMRREGKLDPKAADKARMWLPARVSYQRVEREGDIPPRWVPISWDTL